MPHRLTRKSKSKSSSALPLKRNRAANLPPVEPAEIERQSRKVQENLNSKVSILKHQLSSQKAAHQKEVDQYRSQVKQLTKEREDYRKKFMQMKREYEKVKHMQETSDKIRQNQQALISLQVQKIAKLKGQLYPSR